MLDLLSDPCKLKTFMKKVDQTGPCWEWTGYKNHLGYGRTYMTLPDKSHKLMTVHRLAYVHFNGPIPEGFVVMHSCDNRCCVNPSHLKVGTQYDNIHDMIDKGRYVNGRRAA